MATPNPSVYNLTYPLMPFNGTGHRHHKEDTGIPGILAGLLIPHVICTLFILFRVSSRLLLLRKWFLDDTLITMAWGCSTAVCVVYSMASESPTAIATRSEVELQAQEEANGGGVHPYIMETYLGLVFYQLCLCLTKLSILAFYLRMFSSRPRERYLAWGTVIFVILYGIPMLFMSIFQCHPQDGEFFSKPMLCFSFSPLLIASASLHTATDAWLIVMIVPCISTLDLPPRQKVALAVVLSLSIFVVAASLVRLQLSLHRHFQPSDVGVTDEMAFFVMTILECDIALICACAPTLRPLVARIFPRMINEPQRRTPLESEESGSVNLTVVSYHGYPWTEPATPVTRTRSGSVASHLSKMSPSAKMPAPPVPALAMSHRTPTTLSLRSMISGITPRSRGRTMPNDEQPIMGKELEIWRERRSSVGFEGYHDQYTAHGEETGRKGDHTKTNSFGEPRWGESQESFVLGLNDPLSPNRLSPVSGLSGETYAAFSGCDVASLKGEGMEERIEAGRDTRNRDEEREPEENKD